MDIGNKEAIQRFALAVFAYQAASLDKWSVNTGWLTDASVCDWYGIDCDGNGLVTSINLRNNGVKGNFIPELSMLADTLTYIDIGENGVKGKIPKEIGYFSNLATLLMDENEMEKDLPDEISGMSSLQKWDLHHNYFTGTVPQSINQLSKLEELYLWGNELTGSVPTEICDFPNLDSFMVDCQEVEIDCWTRCYYQCGGDTGVPCNNSAQEWHF
jgi:Leucine-rich repeat (LRR) protein